MEAETLLEGLCAIGAEWFGNNPLIEEKSNALEVIKLFNREYFLLVEI